VNTKILHSAGCEELIDNDGVINLPSEGYFLKIDKSIHYNSSKDPERLGTNPQHEFAYWCSFFMGIIFVVGIPVGYLYLLWGQRFNLDPGQDALVGQRTANFLTRKRGSGSSWNMNGMNLSMVDYCAFMSRGRLRKGGSNSRVHRSKRLEGTNKKKRTKSGDPSRVWTQKRPSCVYCIFVACVKKNS